jgi:hypothetical protein
MNANLQGVRTTPGSDCAGVVATPLSFRLSKSSEAALRITGNDYVAFVPHADIDQDGDDIERNQVRAQFFDIEKERHDRIAEKHDPEDGRILPRGAPVKYFTLKRIAAVPGDKGNSVR